MQPEILGVTAPLISVIIPVYNVEQYLRKCVDSVRAQTYRNLEIILIDDGSTDSSSRICDEYAAQDSRIKVIHQKNQGVSAARNAGLKIAKGEYVGFVDADDYIEADMYQYLYHLCVDHQTSVSVCNYACIINGVKRTMPPISKEGVFPISAALEKLHTQLFSFNKLFKKQLVGHIEFSTDIFIGEDMMFCVAAFDNAQKIAYGPDAKYNYVQNAASATKQTFNPKKMTYFQAANYVLQYAQKRGDSVLQKKIKSQICYHTVGFLRQIAASGGADESIIVDLQQKVRAGIMRHLFSYHKLTNKLFAIMCCGNFKLACWVYNLLER